MSLWAWATDLAIWVLIGGSLGIFGWFLIEVRRLLRERLARERSGAERGDPDEDGGPDSADGHGVTPGESPGDAPGAGGP